MQAMNEHLTIKVSTDGYEAHAYGDGSHEPIALSDLNQLLVRSGVVYGVVEASLQSIVESGINGQPILIAKGVEPTQGEDGWVEYFFDHEKARPAEEKDGSVDLHEMHYIHNTRRGERLALIHPPGEGIPGKMVTGNVVAARIGKKPAVRAGQHTVFSPEDPNVLLADNDGNVSLRVNGTIEVHPAIVIRGNVDFSTGNIDFVGSLKVMGDIKSDFSVKVEKNLEVLGYVEDAHVEVGGDLHVHKGFVGGGKGVLMAKGNIKVLHVMNQAIISERDIVVEKESVSGNLRAGGKIIASNATIAGGLLEADEEVEARNLGSGEYPQAHVRVGRKARIIDRLAQLDKDLRPLEKQTADVKDAVYRLIRMKLDTGVLDADKEQMLSKLQAVQKQLPGRLEMLHQEKVRLTGELKQDCKARVVVRGTVFENVLIEINGIRRVVDNALQDVIFVERAGTIEIRSS